MATTTPSPQTPRSRKSDASNISNHRYHASENGQRPKGPCHFRSLSAGQNPPRCGCQRFLIDRDVRGDDDGGDGDARNPRCGCGHKANFHEASLPGTATGFISSSQTAKSPGRSAPVTSAVGPLFLQVVQHPTHQGRSSASYVKLDPGLVRHDQARPEGTNEGADQVRYSQNRTPSRSGAKGGNASILPPIPPECLLSSQEGQITYQGDHNAFGGNLPSAEFPGQYRVGRTDAVETSNPGLGVAPAPEYTSAEAFMVDATAQENLDHLAGDKGDSFAQRTQGISPRSGSLRGHRTPAPYLSGDSVDRQSIDPRKAVLQTTNLPVQAITSANHQGTPEELFLSASEPATTPNQRGTPDLRALSGLDGTFREFKALTGRIRQGNSNGPQNEGSRQDLSQGENSRQVPVGPPNTLPMNRVYVSDDLGKLIQQLMPCLDALSAQLAAVPGLATAFRKFGKRLEALENASTTSTPSENRVERIDLLDDRLTEVAAQVEDLDSKVHAILDETLTVSSRRQGGADETIATLSFTSHTSLRPASSSAVMAAAMENAEMKRQIVELTSKISEVELLLPPSIQRPWQVEVIMIPWGSRLHGIWAMSDSADGRSGTGEWTQTQGRNSAALSRTNSFREPEKYESAWDGPSIREWAQGATNWMIPKACGMKSKVYKRLESRGLIRNVEVTGGSARDVEHAIVAEFGDVIRVLNENVASTSSDVSRSQNSEFIDVEEEMVLGLKAPYIPLRKIHKNPRLRFLTKNEMVSSALWTVEFLTSSVVMKGKDDQRILFVTHRDGYTQPSNGDSEWTWQRLRELPKVDLANSTTEESGNTVREADAREACWGWDSRLDPPISVNSSFTSEPSRESVLSIRNRQSSGQPVKEEPSGTPEQVTLAEIEPEDRNLPVSPMSNYPPGLRAQNQGKNLMRQVPIVAINTRTSQSKRREASRGTVSTVSPLAKRRKMPPSWTNEELPSNRGVIWNATPRESQPASPFFSEVAATGESRSQAASGGIINSRKGETQFAYATPYSGTVPALEKRGRGRMIKREMEVEMNEGGDGHEYEPWKGIQDDEEGGGEGGEVEDDDKDDNDDDDDDEESESDEEQEDSEPSSGGEEEDELTKGLR